MKTTMSNTGTTKVKTWGVLFGLCLLTAGILFAQGMGSDSYVQGTKLMVRKLLPPPIADLSPASPYIMRGVLWNYIGGNTAPETPPEEEPVITIPSSIDSVPFVIGSGAPELTTTNAVIGNAYHFNGVNDELRVTAPVANLPLGSTARSLNLWFRPENNSLKPQVVFCYGSKVRDDAFYLIWTESNGGTFMFGRWGGGDAPAVYGYPAGSTYMITLAYPGGTGAAKIYINGVLKGTATRSLKTKSTYISIGGATYANHYVKGMIDEVSLWGKALSQSEITALYNSGAGVPVAGTESGFIASWGFGGETIINPTPASSKVVVSSGSPQHTTTSAVIGSAYHFNGVDGELRVPDPVAGLPVGNAPRSLNLWFKPENKEGNPHGLFIYGNQEGDDAFYLLWYEGNGGTFQFGCWGGGDRPRVTGYPAGQTYMVTLTYAGGSNGAAKIYINGALVGEDTRSLHTTATPILIGGLNFPDHYVKGMIDEVSLWNRPLGQDEITALYNNGSGRQVADGETGLVGNWNFDSKSSGASSPPVIDPVWLKEQYRTNYERDILLMKQLRANTVRAYTDFGTNPVDYSPILNKFYTSGLMVIMTVGGTKAELDSQSYLDVVNAYKSHPAILMWNVGADEWNRGDYMGYGDIGAAIDAIHAAAQAIKFNDPNHAVSSVIFDDLDTVIMRDIINYTAVDVWGVNTYRGASLGTVFEEWGEVSTKPFYLSRLGIDSDDQAELAGAATGLWSEVGGSLSASDDSKNCLGATMYEFSDLTWSENNIMGAYYNALQGYYANMAKPVVSSVNPTPAPSASDVTLTGVEFHSAGSVMVGGVSVQVLQWTDTQVRVRLPAISDGQYDIVLTDDINMSAEPAMLVIGTLPSITSISPEAGSAGMPIVITGTDFGVSGTVEFNGSAIPAEDIISWTPTEINCNVPAGLEVGSYSVTVTLAGIGTSNGIGFEALPIIILIPTITSVEPVQAVAGTEVAIRGSDFGNPETTSTRFLGFWSAATGVIRVTEFVEWSDTIVRFTVPALGQMPLGPYLMSLNNDYGGCGGITFTVLAPQVTSLSPAIAPLDYLVEISGTSFGTRPTNSDANYKVRVGSTDLFGPTNVPYWTDTLVKFKVPSGGTAGSPRDVKVMRCTSGVWAESNVKPLTVPLPPQITSVYKVGTTDAFAVPGDTIIINGNHLFESQVPLGTYQVSFVGGASVTAYGPWNNASIQCTIPPDASVGAYTVRVETPDGVANSPSTFLVKPHISLSTASASPGYLVTVSGVGFGTRADLLDPNYQVMFGGTALNGATTYSGQIDVPIWAPGQVTFHVPSLGAGNYNVSIKSPAADGSLVESNIVVFTVPAEGIWVGDVYRFNTNPRQRYGVVGDSIVIEGSGFGPLANAGKVVIGNTEIISFSQWTDGQIMTSIPNMISGRYLVRVFDAQNRGDVWATRFQVNGPYIRNLDAYSGTIGSEVVIRPTNNDGYTAGQCLIKFNGVDLAPKSGGWLADTYIKFDVPAGTNPGTYDIKITKNGGATWSGLVRYTVFSSEPYIRNLDAYSGTIGSEVVIRPTNNGGYTAGQCLIKFNGVDLAPKTVSDVIQWTADSRIKFDVPAGTNPGTYDIQITRNGTTTWSGPVRYTVYQGTRTNQPTVTSLNSPVRGGDTVTVYGTGFGSGGTVYLGSVFSTGYTSDNGTSFTFIVPSTPPNHILPNTYYVYVETPFSGTADGGVCPGGVGLEILTSSPTVTSLNSPVMGGGTVNVSGTNLGAGGTVHLGSVFSTGYTSDNGTSFTFIVPDTGAYAPPNHILPNTYFVWVETNYGACPGGVGLEILTSSPTVTGATPSPTTGGTTIDVTGTNFDLGTLSLRFGGSMPGPIAATVLSPTQLTFTLPHEPLANTYHVFVETAYGVSNGGIGLQKN